MSDTSRSTGSSEGAEKAPDAFRTISEVAEDLDLPQHVLRFWETRFSQIKPLKRGGGRRYYRPQDVELLRGIRRLLYGEGYTIRGVQRILREQGPRFVVAAAHGAVETSIVEDAPAPVITPPEGDDDDGASAMARRLARSRGEPEAVRPTRPTPEQREPQPAPAPTLAREPESPAPPSAKGLSPDEVRRLEATLSDLLEMKRILDQAR